jgi:hypothetical protein
MASLEAKGMIVDSGERMDGGMTVQDSKANDWYADDRGIDAVFAAPEVDASTALTEALAKAAVAEAEEIALGVPFPGLICATLRNHAGPWEGTRKSFVELVASVGYNRATAATQWQRARGK